MTLSIIAAIGRNGAIGRDNRLPWHIPEDLQHFKQLTWGHPVIMGHHTFLSLPHAPLPGRDNIVLSHTVLWLKGCIVCPSLDEALLTSRRLAGGEESFIIGGESLYRQALPLATRLYLTLVDEAPTNADSFFPAIHLNEWTTEKKETHQGYTFVQLSRVKS